MKVLISVDLEGISGITHSSQATPDARDYDWARTMMAGDANAAVEGALAAGATEILVADSHDGMRNLRLNELHPAATLVSGGGRPLSMLHGLDETFDAVMMVGYHTMCGNPEGIMNHAYISKGLTQVRMDRESVGEIGIFGRIAGYFGVPVVMVSGDSATCEEARNTFENVTAVEVKKGINRFAAICVSQQEAHRRLQEGAQNGLENRAHIKPLVAKKPTAIAVTFSGSQCADAAARLPGTIRDDDYTVSYTGDDYLDVFQRLRLMFELAADAVNRDY